MTRKEYCRRRGKKAIPRLAYSQRRSSSFPLVTHHSPSLPCQGVAQCLLMLTLLSLLLMLMMQMVMLLLMLLLLPLMSSRRPANPPQAHGLVKVPARRIMTLA